jgi:hypothetical protein
MFITIPLERGALAFGASSWRNGVYPEKALLKAFSTAPGAGCGRR